MTTAVAALPHDLTVWRLTAWKHAAGAFSGEGARRFGGRWNRKGGAVVYTASTRSLAILEMLVQADPLPAYAAIPATLPAGLALAALDESALPPDWRGMPAPESPRSLGGVWLAAGNACALRAPSAVVPAEYNYLLNPAHPDFARITIGRPEVLFLDRRLL